MTVSPTRLTRQLVLAASLAISILPLASCGGPDPDRFPPPCPQPSIPRDSGDLHIFRGAGRDITDNILDGHITGIFAGTCKRDTTAITVVTLSVGMTLTRGPANPSRTADVSYFVAVTDGDKILDKRIYTLRAEFPPNTERLNITGDQVELRIPVTRQKSAAAYTVIVGFQLTPAQLEVNRARNGH
jgi:hypothetical protein